MKAIIFDLDGVLVDTEPLQLLNKYNFFKEKNPKIEYTDLYPTIGMSKKQVFDFMCSMFFKDYDVKTLKDEYKNFKSKMKVDYTDLVFPYTRSLLDRICEYDIKLGIASSSKMHTINKVLDTCELRKYFDVVVSGEIFAETKPNPEIYKYTMEKLGVTADECIIIEDSYYGIKAAKRAHAFTLARYESRFYFSQDKADYIYKDNLELFQYLTLNVFNKLDK